MKEVNYSLSIHGDKLEKYASEIFLINDYFPTYEIFWKKFVIPLTNRDKNIYDIRIKNDPILDRDTFHSKVCIAQLHYSVLANLLIAHDIKSKKIDYSKAEIDLISLTHIFTHIFSAIDIAEELIIRYKDLPKNTYPPWDDSISIINARRDFSKKEPQNIQNARKYRNRLVHGRLIPAVSYSSKKEQDYIPRIGSEKEYKNFVPRIGREREYLDWRKVMNNYVSPDDFQDLEALSMEVFVMGTKYLDNLWKEHLI